MHNAMCVNVAGANATVGIAPDPADGLSFNLFNNQYWTNYVLWYPFNAEDNHIRSRFEMRMH